MTDETTESSVRASGPGEGARGNREVPPAETETTQVETTPAPVADAPDTTTPNEEKADT